MHGRKRRREWRYDLGKYNCLKLRIEILTGYINLEVIGILVTLKPWEWMQYLWGENSLIMITEFLQTLCINHCSEHFTCYNPVNPYNNPIKSTLFIISL